MRFAKKPPRRTRTPNLLPNTLCPSFRVTMEARRRHFRATPPGIERMVVRFDRRILGHADKLWKIWEELKKIVKQQESRSRLARRGVRLLTQFLCPAVQLPIFVDINAISFAAVSQIIWHQVFLLSKEYVQLNAMIFKSIFSTHGKSSAG